MLTELALKGYLTGIVVSIPLGPVAILLIQRTANRNFKSGLATGIGIGIADTIYATIAGFSLTYILDFLRTYQVLFQIIGAIVLFVLGYSIFRSHPLEAIRKFKRKGTNTLQCFGTAFLLTLSNPIIVLMYVAILATSGLVFSLNHLGSTILVLGGFFSGTLTWWLIVTTLISLVRHKFNLRVLWWFNKISGLAVMLFVVITTIVILINGNPKI